MTNKDNNVLYTGVTYNLKKRVYEHKEKLGAGSRQKKINLVNSINRKWIDLYEEL